MRVWKEIIKKKTMREKNPYNNKKELKDLIWDVAVYFQVIIFENKKSVIIYTYIHIYIYTYI